MMKCILLGSGPEMTRINDIEIDNPDIRIVGLNNIDTHTRSSWQT